MSDQKIKLQVGADASELMAVLDQVVKKTQQAQNQLKSLTASPKPPQNVVSPEEKRYQQVLGDVKKDEERARVNRAAQEVAKRQLQDIRREIEANGRAESKNEKDREQAQRNINRLKEEERRIAETLNRLQGKTGSGANPTGTRNPSSNIGAGGITSAGGLASALGVPAMVIGAAATAGFALKISESIRRSFAEAQVEARAVQTQAFNTKGQSGQLLESAITGGGLEDLMFSKQRAAGQATAENRINQRYAMTGPVNDALSYFGAGQRVRNTFGAIQHFNLPQAYRAAIGSPLYQANINSEKANEAAVQTEVEKNAPENKGSTVIKEQYLRDFQNNLAFQRQTGMSEDRFRNFNISNANLGFTQEQGMGASSAILAAGGGTRNAAGNAGFSLQMQRQFDLTNAPQALGSLGGQLGSAQLSREALIKVQAEGTRIGLNQSDLREENRKFVEMASAAIGQSSVTSKEGIGDILETFGKFMSGANTTQSLQAGKSAYEAYQAFSKSQSGPEAVLRQAGMRSDTNLGKLSELDRTTLSLMGENDVTTDSQRIKAMAAKSGLSPEQIVKSYKENLENSTFVLPSTRAALANYKKADLNMQGPLSPEEMQKRQSQFESAQGELMSAETYSGATAGMDEKTLRQFNQQFRVRGMTAQAQENAPRPGDETNKQLAEMTRLSNEMFKSMQTDLDNTANATARFTVSINNLIKAYQTGDQKAIADYAKMHNLGGQRATNQTQAGTGGAGQ